MRGYETAALLGMNPKAGDFWKMLTWQLGGNLGRKARRESKWHDDAGHRCGGISGEPRDTATRGTRGERARVDAAIEQ